MVNAAILKNTLLYTLGNLLPQVLGLALLPLFTKYLSPNDYGVANYLTVVSIILTQLSLLGLNGYLLRFAVSKQDHEKLIAETAVFTVLVGVMLHGIALVIAPLVIEKFEIKIHFWPFWPLAILISFFDILSTYPLIKYRVEEKGKEFLFFSAMKLFTKYIFSIFAIMIFNWGIVGKLYADLLATFVFFAISAHVLKISDGMKLQSLKPARALTFSFPFFISGLFYLLTDTVDRFFIERYVGLSDLGYFSIASAFSAAYSGFVISMYRSIEPSVYRSYDSSSFHMVIEQSKLYFFPMVAFAGVSAALFSAEILSLMADKSFSSAVPLMPMLILSAAFQSFSVFYGMIPVAHKRSSVVLFQNSAVLLIVVFANSVLIPKFGVNGAVYSKCCASILGSLFSLFYAKHIDKSIGYNRDLAMASIGIGIAIATGLLLDHCNDKSFAYSITAKATLLLLCTLILLKIFKGSDGKTALSTITAHLKGVLK